MDKARLELISANAKELEWSMDGSASEYTVRSYAFTVLDDVTDLLVEVRRLKALVGE